MKLTVIFILFACLQVSANGFSQRVTITGKNITLQKVFRQIHKQTGYQFFYEDEMLDRAGRIDINVKNEPLKEVLARCFEGLSLGYSVNNNAITVRPQTIRAALSIPELPAYKGIRGAVKDAEGNPLAGVSVIVRGTTRGTSTGADGSYSVDANEGDVLVFSFVGYNSVESVVGSGSVVNITMMASAASGLDEVVLVGYGTKRREQLTGSVASLNNEDVMNHRTTDIEKSLQGAVPGLIVRDIGGEPGKDNAEILIRGVHTLGDNSPLFVVDGVPQPSISYISPYDIEEISVLKDASAAIYGARAANGVILVKTRRGKQGKATLQLNTDYGMNSLTREPHLFSSEQYAIYRNEAFQNLGMPKPFSDEDIEKYRTGSDPLTHPNTDWYRAAFKKNALVSNHNVSVTGGNENVQYFVSGTHHGEKSNYSSNDGFYNMYQLTSNIDAKVNKYLKLGVDLNLRFRENRQPPVGIGGVTHRAWFNYPTEVARYPNGLPGTVHEDGNTTVINNFMTGFDEQKEKLIQPRLSFDFNMDWLTEGLGLRGYGAFYYNIINRRVLQKPVLTYQYNPNTGEYDSHKTLYPGSGHNQLSERNDLGEDRLYNVQLTYQRRFGKHGFDGFIAYEQSESNNHWIQAGRRDLFSPDKVQLFAGMEEGRSVDGTTSLDARVNYFGNISYDFDRKYMIDFTFRRDGSFNFPQEHRFGNFPSVSVAWNINKESFMRSANIDNLKLRLSYGSMGNDKIANFQYLTKYGYGDEDDGDFVLFGTGAVYNPAISITSIPNPQITWEKSRMINTGVDLILFNQKFSTSLDYFYEKRRDILIQRNLSIPIYTAINLPDENLGKVDNWGIEFQSNYNNRSGDFIYSIGGNFTFNRSKIVFMDEPKNIPDYQRQEGHPVNSILAYDTDGLFRSRDEIDHSPHINGAFPGSIKYLDINGDGAIDDADRVRFYKSPTPEIQFGLNGSLSYKGIGIYMMLQGQGRATTVLRFNDDGGKPQEYFTERWTVENPNAKLPAPTIGRSQYSRLSSFHFFDASYLRLKSLELSYDLVYNNILPKNTFREFKIYLRARNLFTLDHVKIFDPEVPVNIDARGSRARYYPQLKTLSLGLSITF